LDRQLKEGITGMPAINTKDGTEIFYKDWGSGQPIVFSHGRPLSADDWDAQMLFFLSHGYRLIAHDRRGRGRSSKTGDDHDMDHYADDLATLSAHLDLKNAVHVGHSSGGGEVAHYLARHGESRVAKVALIRCGATADGEDRCQPERFAKEGPRRLPVGARRQALS
jgi:non-heme chloroperoxidase